MTIPDAETLRRLYEDEGKTVRELAALARCRMATLLAALDAAGIVRRPGRRRRPLPELDREVLRAIARLGGRARARAAARALGVNRRKLDVLLGQRQANRGNLSRHVLCAHDDAVRAAYDAGTPVRVIAAHYGCSRRAVGKSLDRTAGSSGKQREPSP